jgi:hypothetical protein
MSDELDKLRIALSVERNDNGRPVLVVSLRKSFDTGTYEIDSDWIDIGWLLGREETKP